MHQTYYLGYYPSDTDESGVSRASSFKSIKEEGNAMGTPLPTGEISAENVLGVVGHMRDLWNNDFLARLNSITDAVQRIEETMTHADGQRAGSSSHRTVPPVSDEDEHPRGQNGGVAALRFRKTLTKLKYAEVKSFIKQFMDYVDAAGMNERVAKCLFMQQTDGPVLTFLETIDEEATLREIIEKLKQRVQPSSATRLRNVLACKQRDGEKIQSFYSRFSQLAHELDNEHEDVFVRNLLVENLSPMWKRVARSLVLNNTNTTTSGLFESMVEIEGPGFDEDRMDVDAMEPNHPENMCAIEEGQVVDANGWVNFSAVKNVGTLMMAVRQICRKNSREFTNLKTWLDRNPPNLGQQTPRRDHRTHHDQRRQYGTNQSRRQMPPQRTNRVFNVETTNQFEALHDDPLFDADEDGYARHEDLTNINNVGPSPTKLMFCPIVVNKHPASGMVDTGAAVSVMSLEMSRKLECPLDKDERFLSCANGSLMKVNGTTQVSVQVGNMMRKHRFMVCECASHDLIIGLDMLENFNAKPNPAHRSLEVARQSAIPCQMIEPKSDSQKPEILMKKLHPKARLPARRKENPMYDFFSARTVVVQPNSQLNIETGVSIQLPKGLCGSFTANQSQSVKHFCGIEHLILDHNYHGPVKILLRNFSNLPMTIEAGDKIAQMAVISVTDMDSKEVANFGMAPPMKESEALPSGPVKAELDLKATEDLTINPVVKDNCLFIPSMKSFVVPAHGSKTLQIPLHTKTTLTVMDSGRLPPGIDVTGCIWTPDKPLRVTLKNATNVPRMLGSRTAIVGVPLADGQGVTLLSPTGSKKHLHCV